ncbi:NifB/NifX family molybdenum-iron cluster-binding protein [Plasticicumulans acidivorans]|uniref:Nitrogen fixation protein NifX n=1 Tax=Plasticicumulans acidivorans TaxID=886464 RepID=A0A317MW47_9GAMM|nr:NifB/NifX family molybdenum-iron cluster-binding protein [Plasticicumulans acidivorans]PWV63079.1 nitrogen fixation protein NifX [Plasticicumulans acidivorans]
MIKVAFASNDQVNVNLHFGAADTLVIYEVSPGYAELLGVGEFIKVEMKGENRFKSLSTDAESNVVELELGAEELERLAAKPPEDKVIAKLDFLQDCAAVYAASIGTSSIKRLIAAGIQPIIVGTGQTIEDLLNEVSLALHCGGLSWVERAKRQAERRQAAQSAAPTSAAAPGLRLITSIDELD